MGCVPPSARQRRPVAPAVPMPAQAPALSPNPTTRRWPFGSSRRPIFDPTSSRRSASSRVCQQSRRRSRSRVVGHGGRVELQMVCERHDIQAQIEASGYFPSAAVVEGDDVLIQAWRPRRRTTSSTSAWPTSTCPHRHVLQDCSDHLCTGRGARGLPISRFRRLPRCS